MTPITKIRNIGTAHLNHAEYLAFMTGVRKLIDKATPEADGFVAGLNQLISETKALYRLRLSQKKEREQKKDSQA
ncbi:MAG: hypothetical protein AB2L24_15525 [Mangrovibacterium sp.]